MKEATRQRLVSSNIWTRALYMVLYMIAYSIAEAIIVLLAIFQFLSVLISGRANEPLLEFGKNLSVFIYEVLEFQTFNTEIRPFPFSPWPDEERGGDTWLRETSFETESDEPREKEADTKVDSAELEVEEENVETVVSEEKSSPDESKP